MLLDTHTLWYYSVCLHTILIQNSFAIWSIACGRRLCWRPVNFLIHYAFWSHIFMGFLFYSLPPGPNIIGLSRVTCRLPKHKAATLFYIHSAWRYRPKCTYRNQAARRVSRGGRRNTYGGVARTPTGTVHVVRTPKLRGLWSEHLQQIMCSHNTYTSCLVTRPTLNYV
jgi:hypothetical protein